MTGFQSTLDHPRARYLILGQIAELRRTLRSGRYEIDCRRLIKDAQRQLVKLRQRRAAR